MIKFKHKIICVDFDGVIHSYESGWKGIDNIPDPPVEGAFEWLEKHLPVPDSMCCMAPIYDGPRAVIYSARSKSWRGRRAMKKWFIKHGLHPGYIYENILKFPKKKPAAWLTIDDRCICFEGKFPSDKEINDFQSWVGRFS
jgi:hypothetical protein